MASAHDSSQLDLKPNFPLRADSNTTALFHFNVNTQDALYGIGPAEPNSNMFGIDRFHGKFAPGSLYLARSYTGVANFGAGQHIQFWMHNSSNGAAALNFHSGTASDNSSSAWDWAGLARRGTWRDSTHSGRMAPAHDAPYTGMGWGYYDEAWGIKSFTNAIDSDIRILAADGSTHHWTVTAGRTYILSVYRMVENFVSTTAKSNAGLVVMFTDSAGNVINHASDSYITSSNFGGYKDSDGTWNKASGQALIIEPNEMFSGKCSMARWEHAYVIFKVPAGAARIIPHLGFANWGQAKGQVRYALPMLEDLGTPTTTIAQAMRPVTGNRTPWSGTGNRLAYGNAILNPSAFTISFWVRLNGGRLATNYRAVVTCDGDTTNTAYKRLLIMYSSTTGNPTMNIWAGSTTAYCSVGTGIADNLNEWYHYAITFDGTTYRIYRNGVLAASVAGPVAGPFGSDRVYVGSWKFSATSTGSFLDGHLNELRFDKVARTPEEIALWASLKAPFAPKGFAYTNSMSP